MNEVIVINGQNVEFEAADRGAVCCFFGVGGCLRDPPRRYSSKNS